MDSLIIDADSMFDVVIRGSGEVAVDKIVDRVEDWMRDIAYNSFDVGENYVVALSPRKSFRNRLTETYKANRKERSELKSECLRVYYRKHKERTLINRELEADDWTIFHAHKGYLVAAIDKDIKGVCPTRGVDYKNRKFFGGVGREEARRVCLTQALTGDATDGIPGAQNIGKVKAKSIMKRNPSWGEFSGYFDSEADAILSVRLVNMNQFDGQQIILWEPHDFYGIEKY